MPRSSPDPGKIVCVAQNYEAYIAEQGLEAPRLPGPFRQVLLGLRPPRTMRSSCPPIRTRWTGR